MQCLSVSSEKLLADVKFQAVLRQACFSLTVEEVKDDKALIYAFQ